MNYKNRITSGNITSVAPNEYFVFGSNSEGAHAGGAARYAYDNFGAIMGQSYGVQGRSFGIDTMNSMIRLKNHIGGMITHAMNNPEKTYLVTEIGCGIAGYSPEISHRYSRRR